jgi:hypothetical protein
MLARESVRGAGACVLRLCRRHADRLLTVAEAVGEDEVETFQTWATHEMNRTVFLSLRTHLEEIRRREAYGDTPAWTTGEPRAAGEDARVVLLPSAWPPKEARPGAPQAVTVYRFKEPLTLRRLLRLLAGALRVWWALRPGRVAAHG